MNEDLMYAMHVAEECKKRAERAEAKVKELKFAIKRHREHIHSGSVTVHEADASLWAHEILHGEEER
jgi:predicted translin family RNA/ssDNA-binding protein